MPYISCFKSSTVVNKKILCEILNLNTSRPGLEFSAAEIQKAYKKRALRFHPDKQYGESQPIPIEICNELMNDIQRARDDMLSGKGNGSTKASGPTFKDWEDMLMDYILRDMKGLRRDIKIIKYFCNDISIIMLFSKFSDNQLNIRLINFSSDEIKYLQNFLQKIDGNFWLSFIIKLQQALNQEGDIRTSIMELKHSLPEPFQNKKIDALFDAIYDANQELKKILTHDLIVDIEHIINFLTNLIENIPSWKHILGIYFVSLLYTSSSLPNYFNATKMINEVIWKQKGATSFVLSALPLLMLHSILLPLKISILLGISLTKIALEAFSHLLANIILFLRALIIALGSLFSKETSFFWSVLNLFKTIFASNIRLAVNISIKLLDELIFIVSHQNIFHSFLNTFNDWIASQLTGNDLPTNIISTTTESIDHEETNKTFGFIDSRIFPLHNEEDKWLAEVLAAVVEDKQNSQPNLAL